MNKIKIVNDKLDTIDINKNINIDYYEQNCLFGINEIKLNINKDSDLYIEIKLKEETRLSFNINIRNNVKLNLNILTKGKIGKIKYTYNLDEKSLLNAVKFQNVDTIKEMVVVNLNGLNSEINYNFKTISNNKEIYDYNIFHNCKNTISNIKNNGVCIKKGEIIYQVSSFVPKNITGCIVSQNNRIINLTDNKCEIKPNLYIDTNDVEANHSALIGKFSEEEMFYLQSRGLDYNTALKLLINGFLTSGVEDKKIFKEINKNIDHYWR